MKLAPLLCLPLIACAATTPRAVARITAPTPPPPLASPRLAPPTLEQLAWMEYTRALEIDLERPDAWYNLARLYEDHRPNELRHLECSKRLYQRFIERASGAPRLQERLRRAQSVLRSFHVTHALVAVGGASGTTYRAPPVVPRPLPPAPDPADLPKCPL